jgi:hypothetical protein
MGPVDMNTHAMPRVAKPPNPPFVQVTKLRWGIYSAKQIAGLSDTARKFGRTIKNFRRRENALPKSTHDPLRLGPSNVKSVNHTENAIAAHY